MSCCTAKGQQRQDAGEAPAAAPAGAPVYNDCGNNAQRNPSRMLKTRKGNTEIRNGKCYIFYRSELDPRWPEPQFIDEQSVDRSRLDSLNLRHLNLDVLKSNHIKCMCTRMINLLEDWYVQNHEGTILCSSCARCFRCRTSCFSASRKLNSIDGLVLCNACMLNYGSYREPQLRPKLQPLEKLDAMMELGKFDPKNASMAKDLTSASVTIADSHDSKGTPILKPSERNTRLTIMGKKDGGAKIIRKRSKNKNKGDKNNNNNNNNNNVKEDSTRTTHLEKPRFRDEGRRPLRLIYYPNPRPKNYGRPDHLVEAPPYLGVDRNAGSQACPGCAQPALGGSALVVPSMARVYHERSFRCANCKKPMHMGYQLPMSQFHACSCTQQVKVYCTDYACQAARREHHAEHKCTLGPLHPGGRPQRDVPGFVPRIDPEAAAKEVAELAKKQRDQWELRGRNNEDEYSYF